MNDRRLKTLRISPELFFELFRDGLRAYRVIRDAVPLDAQLVNVRHGWPNYIEVLISSSEFDEVTEGEIVPLLEPVAETVNLESPESPTRLGYCDADHHCDEKGKQDAHHHNGLTCKSWRPI